MDARINDRSYVEAGGGSGISTALIWARIRRRKWLIAVSSTILFGLFSAILVLLPVRYTAETEVVVEQRPQGVDLAAVLSRMPTDSQAILTEAEALRSRVLVQRVINQLNLLTNPEFNPRNIPQDDSPRSRWRQAKAAAAAFIDSLLPKAKGPSAGDPVLNEATDIFLMRLRVTPVGRSQILKATFTSESPELASEILNVLVSLYLATQMETRVAVPTKMGDFLKSELDRLKAKVREANDAVERYRNEAQLQQGIAYGRETLLYTQELSEANRELVAVRLKRQEAEARLSEIRANPKFFSDVLGHPLIQQLRNQLSVLKESRSQMIASYGSFHPNRRQIETSIADAERRLNVEVANIGRSLASDVTVQTEREAQLVQTIANLKDQLQKAGGARVTLASLEQEADVNRTILSTFLTQYNQLKSQRALQIADSYVLAPADIPSQPSFPPLLPFLGLAFVVSVALSGLSALLLERTGETIRNAQEVQPLLAARLLGIIPKLETMPGLLTKVIDSPQSQLTESIRSVLSRFMAPRNLGRAILIASAQSREGRTSLSIALARLAALSGRRAILIDCDLRRPALHDAFGAKIGPGLTDLLQNELELGSAIRRDALTPLDYITGGQLAPHAANLLCLPEMADLLVKLRTEYDLVVLDSPPSATVADASFVAQIADECLFVVSWNKTPWRLVREQMEELSQHCRLTGVVLNQVDMRKHSKFYLPIMAAWPTALTTPGDPNEGRAAALDAVPGRNRSARAFLSGAFDPGREGGTPAAAPLSTSHRLAMPTAEPTAPAEALGVTRHTQRWLMIALIGVSLAAMAVGWWLYGGEAAGRGEINAHAAARAVDEATPLDGIPQAERTQALARELTITAAAQQAAERTAIELRQALQQERDNAETLARGPATARRELETRGAALNEPGEKTVQSQQQLAELRQGLQSAETSAVTYQELLAEERARNHELEQQPAIRQDAAPSGSRNITAGLADTPRRTPALSIDKPSAKSHPTSDKAQPSAMDRPAPMAARPPTPEAPGPELQRLMSRARLLLGQGDVNAARSVLERAAEMGSVPALFALAETFDPLVLSAWGTFGTKGDVEKARELYANAFAGGVQEAKDRLAALRR